MADKTSKRLSQIARELNVGTGHLAEYLQKKGKDIKARPNVRVSAEDYQILLQEFSSDKDAKKESEKLSTKLSKQQQEEQEQKQKVSEVTETTEEFEQEEIETTEKLEQEEIESTEKLEQQEIESSESTVSKEQKEEKSQQKSQEREKEDPPTVKEEQHEEKISLKGPEIIDKIDLDALEKRKKSKPEEKTEKPVKQEETQEKEQVETEKQEEKKEDAVKIEQEKTEKTEEVVADELPEKKEEQEKEKIISETEQEPKTVEKTKGLNVIDRIDLDALNQKTRPKKKSKEQLRKERMQRREEEEKRKTQSKKTEAETKEKEKKNQEIQESEKTENKTESEEDTGFIKTKVDKLTGPTVVGRIELTDDSKKKKRKKRKRIKKQKPTTTNEQKDTSSKDKKTQTPRKEVRRARRPEIKEEDINKKINEVLAKLEKKGTKHAVSAKNRRKKRDKQHEEREIQKKQELADAKKIEVTEFISANELANLMEVSVNEVIKKCFDLGKMVAINQRLDADTIAIVAEEFGMEAEFVSIEEKQSGADEPVDESKLKPRPPIVTVMGHVDHGKTSLLDFIRKANVIAGEAGGITQHIGAYNVKLDDGKAITFLDTPGHEAFTAMRARGAKVTDLAIIIIAADDDIMPQTEEAISHTQAADVPMIFAINKIDKEGADPQRIKQQLAERNLLVEEWGGKYQSTDISAKEGLNVDKLLDEVLLAAEMLELKANPDKPAEGTVIEAQLDKGRGYVSTILIESGTLKHGDIIRSGSFSGRVKAMFNERDMQIESAGPSEPVMVLGLNGAPIAGDSFKVMDSEKEARDLAQKYGRLKREQTLRTRKHITLDEIGRRIKIGNFKELNVVIKSDVIGSSEALADSFIKQSNEEIQVNVIHKGVGQISEADVNLAAASDAVIIGFQIRPSLAARKLAEQEEIDIRTYSVIYDAIEELRAAMEGMLSPEIKEEIRSTVEVREVFKISKVGSIAGCYVMDGKINRKDKIRVIRDGVVIYTGHIDTLKRFKDDVKEVPKGYECGLSIENFNDIKKDDIVESFIETEVAKKLD